MEAYKTIQNICRLRVKELLEKKNRIFIVNLQGNTEPVELIDVSCKEEILTMMKLILFMEQKMNDAIPVIVYKYRPGERSGPTIPHQWVDEIEF